MPLVLLKEDGSGLAGANSYACVADGDAYHDGHLYASLWTAATSGSKAVALVMASRLIDGLYLFNGSRKVEGQGLQWPRELACDPDRRGVRVSVLDSTLGDFFDSDSIPAVLVSATCEFARELLKADRTVDPAGQGIKQLQLVGSLGVTFDIKNAVPVVPAVVQAMLSKLGALVRPGGGVVRLVRV